MINQIIPKSKLEIIKDRIKLIITNEMTAQKVLATASAVADDIAYKEMLETFWNGDNLNIFKDRFQELQSEEYNAIIINPLEERDENGTLRITKPESTFAIDFLARAKSDDNKRGDEAVNELLQRVSGVIRMVFLTATYMRLGFDTTDKFIRRQNITSRKFYVPNSNDSDHVSGVTLTLQVDYDEEIIQSVPVILKGNDTILSDSFNINTDTEE